MPPRKKPITPKEPPQKLGVLIESALDTPLKNKAGNFKDYHRDTRLNNEMTSLPRSAASDDEVLRMVFEHQYPPKEGLTPEEREEQEEEIRLYQQLWGAFKGSHQESILPPLRQATLFSGTFAIKENGKHAEPTCGDALNMAVYDFSRGAKFKGSLIEGAEKYIEDLAATDPIGLNRVVLRDEAKLGDHIIQQQDGERIGNNLRLLAAALEAVEYHDTGKQKISAYRTIHIDAPPAGYQPAYKAKTEEEIVAAAVKLSAAEMAAQKTIIAQASPILDEAIAYEKEKRKAAGRQDTLGQKRQNALIAAMEELRDGLKPVVKKAEGRSRE